MDSKEKEKYIALNDGYLKDMSDDKTPDAVTRDLSYCLSRQAERLKDHNIVMHEEYLFQDEAITGAIEPDKKENSTPFRGAVAYRETVRTTEFYQGGEKVFNRREPVTFYSVIVDKDGGSDDVTVNCPNCGAATLASKLQEGCPYCGTFFKISELFPRISSCYTVDGIIERVGFEDRLKKFFTRFAIAAFAVILIFLFITDRNETELPVVFLVLKNLFLSGMLAALLTFVSYMCYSASLVVKVFAQLGNVLPMLGAGSSQNRLKKKMENLDPNFFIRIFEGKLVSLLQAVLYSNDRDTLSIYEGNDDLSEFDDMIDMDYRGVFKLRDFGIRNGRVSILLEVFTDNTYAQKRLKRRKEQILVRMERSANAVTDTGFSIHAVRCGNCGGSFDALHERNCPYCGNEYHAADSDWVITEIRKK